MSDDSSQGFYGFQGLTDDTSPFNRHSFQIRQELQRVRTGMLVTIKAVHPDKNGGPPTVDVQPLVKQIDGQGNATDHGTIYGLATHRIQGGDFAIVNDPVVGDIGSIAVHDRDISAVKSSGGKSSPPGSFRRHDPADGVYTSQVLNKKPVHMIQVVRDGQGNVTSINITSPAQLNFNGVVIDKDGNITAPGTITAKGEITAGYGGSDSVTLQQHVHPGTQQPTPGT